MKKKVEKSDKKDKVLIVLEDMNTSIKLIAEGQQFLRDEMNRRFDDSDKNLDDFKDEMFGLRKGMYSFRDEMYKFRDDTKANFKAILDHQFGTDGRLEDIEKELKEIKAELKDAEKNGISKEGFNFIVKRVEKMEKEMEKYKTLFHQAVKNHS